MEMEHRTVSRFRLRPEASRATARRMNRRFLATFVAVVVLVLAAYGAGLRDPGRGLDALVIPFALLLVLAAFSYVRRMRRFRARWASFEIGLEDEAIGRAVIGFPPVRILRADVAAIEEIRAGLAVRARDGRGIVVPRELDGYERVREALAGWGTIATRGR
ncbi:hypothetical protein [Anaeromyxobacter terrae]|uniref:hypothetical protein n=1 Tax=Anaeromyxobacter terrae TaxID=2925406 RepID=UPI001F593365|nr:hypothetical protein [Anaeromyxobacter sp. SG22]